MALSHLIEFKERLKKASTLKQMTDVLNDIFDTDKPLGAIAKGIMLSWIDKIVLGSGIKPREK